VRITHPRPAVGRQKFIGVVFHDGVADVESLHPAVEASLLQHGYTIEKELTVDGTEGPFEPLPVAVDGDTKAKTSKARKPSVTVFAAPKIEISIDGERHVVDKDAVFTAEQLLTLTGLDHTRYDIRLHTGPGTSERFEEIIVESDQQFFTASIAATD